MLNDARIAALQKSLCEIKASVWWVAYSGGLDSTVLLHLIATQWADSSPVPIRAIHVNHGLHPDADSWALHCAARCAELGVELHVERVDARPQRGESPEAAAREARYGAFMRHVSAGDVLLTAHHQNDQAETLLLRLMRGAGPLGLAAMPTTRALGNGILFRPLLGCSRAELEAYAREKKLSWIEDSSNQSLKFDRNFVRHHIMPLLCERWPDAVAQLAKAAHLQGERNAWVSDIVETQLESMLHNDGSLLIDILLQQSPALQAELIYALLARHHLPPVPSRKLAELINQIRESRSDAMPCITWEGGEARRYKNRLYVMPPLAPVDSALSVSWSGQQVLDLPWGGRLRIEQRLGGISPRVLFNNTISITPRQGGGRIQLPGENMHRSIKTLLQAAEIPPWQRDRLPLLWLDQQLVAVADRWVAQPFAAAHDELGIHFVHSWCA